MGIRKIWMAAALAATLTLAFGMVACGGGDDDDSNGNGDAEPTTPSDDNGDGATGEPITIKLGDNFFEPKDITVPVNTEVEITVNNEGTAVHNMHVLSKEKEGKDFSSDALVNPGASSTFTVKFANKGEYNFQCDYHLPDMAGTITVE
jgi:plastocyanin